MAEELYFNYRFRLEHGGEKEFKVNLDPKTLNLINVPAPPYPDWTRLEFNQCPNCPLKSHESPQCPVAVSLLDIIETFRDYLSYVECDVVVETKDRTYSKHTALQNGLSSIVGICMVASGCPIMAMLKPMVKYHLPFANDDETMYRVFSMYLILQYLLNKKGSTPDWELKKLVDIYNDVRIVNKNFCKRLSAIPVKDASVNALVNLDCFAMSITFSLTGDMLDDLQSLFSAYLK